MPLTCRRCHWFYHYALAPPLFCCRHSAINIMPCHNTPLLLRFHFTPTCFRRQTPMLLCRQPAFSPMPRRQLRYSLRFASMPLRCRRCRLQHTCAALSPMMFIVRHYCRYATTLYIAMPPHCSSASHFASHYYFHYLFSGAAGPRRLCLLMLLAIFRYAASLLIRAAYFSMALALLLRYAALIIVISLSLFTPRILIQLSSLPHAY